MNTGIYKLEFSNGLFYIGQAVDIDSRYEDHLKKFREGTHTLKMQKVCNQLKELPSLVIMITCHVDYLDLFESFLINKHLSSNMLLNTAIPKDRLSGVTQRTLDILCDNRNNSIVSILDVLNTHLGRIEGLKLSLDEAEDLISTLEEKRTEEVIQADLKGRISNLNKQRKEAESRLKLCQAENTTLIDLLEKTNKEVYRLKNRGFWSRLFNN